MIFGGSFPIFCETSTWFLYRSFFFQGMTVRFQNWHAIIPVQVRCFARICPGSPKKIRRSFVWIRQKVRGFQDAVYLCGIKKVPKKGGMNYVTIRTRLTFTKRKKHNIQIKNWGFQIKCVSNGKTSTEQMKLYQIQLRLCVVSTVWGFKIKELGPVLMFFFGTMNSWKNGTHFPPLKQSWDKQFAHEKDGGPQKEAGLCLNHRFSAAGCLY